MVWRLFPLHLFTLLTVVIASASSAWARPMAGASRAAEASFAPEPVARAAAPAGIKGAISLPPDAPPLPDAVRADFSRGYTLLRDGDYARADDAFAPYVEHADATVAAEALLRRGQAAVLDGRYQDGLDSLTTLRNRYPDTSQAAEALLLLGVARRGLGDCQGAVDDFQTLAEAKPLLAAHAYSLAAECFGTLGQPAEVVKAEQAVLAANPPRLLRLDALEHQASSYVKLGNDAAALDVYSTLLGESRTRWYTAELLYSVGLVHRDAGRTDRAIQRLTQVVVDYPESKRAPQALDMLNEMGASDQITWYQAGLVRLNQGRYSQAIGAFDSSLAQNPNGPEAPLATYERGVARVRVGATEPGIADLIDVADSWPSSSVAPAALLKAGEAREGAEQFAAAAALYARLESAYPSSAAARDARFRHGFAWYLAGDPGRAVEAWNGALNVEQQSDARARLLLWRGKARAQGGDMDGARADWQAARDAAPDSFAGLRARDLLAGNDAGVMGPAAPVSDAAGDDAGDWLRAQGEDPANLEASITADPRFQRADALLRLGQRTRARWEIDDLSDTYAGKPGHLFVLARLLQARGAYELSASLAQRALAATGQSLLAAPAALQRLAYPLAYPELLDSQREARGIDPLLLAALVRQESTYDPLAHSPADARGLTQVIPSTGQILATKLGWDHFNADELYRPVVSLEFGGLFLKDLLDRFDSRLYPAIAAYNAGPGASARWLAAYGSDDMDVWAERIPYQETNDYVQKVFANYGRYRLIYGAAG